MAVTAIRTGEDQRIPHQTYIVAGVQYAGEFIPQITVFVLFGLGGGGIEQHAQIYLLLCGSIFHRMLCGFGLDQRKVYLDLMLVPELQPGDELSAGVTVGVEGAQGECHRGAGCHSAIWGFKTKIAGVENLAVGLILVHSDSLQKKEIRRLFG